MKKCFLKECLQLYRSLPKDIKKSRVILGRSFIQLLLNKTYFCNGENGTSALPQVNPPPKASRSINSPALSFPSS